MIYLIESSGYKGDNYFKLLKIGYTDDNVSDRRFTTYKLHNPTCQVLYTIPNATEEHEKRVQYKFRGLLFKDYGREWFKYSEEIINYFKSVKSLEELEKLPRGISSHSYLKYKNEIKEMLKYISDIPYDTSEFRKLCKEIYNILGDKILDKEYTLSYLESRFDKNKIDNYFKIKKSRETGIYCKDDIVNQEAYEFMQEYNDLTEARKKLILLCESTLNGSLPKEVVEIVLDQIPDSDYIKSYYTILGPDKLKSLGYKRNNIEKALGIVIFSPELLLDSIYSSFKEGEKYTLAVLKSKLGYIYSSINYSKTPKAIDIENWFNVRNIKLYEKDIDGNKKQSKGYELLKSKEQELRQELKLTN